MSFVEVSDGVKLYYEDRGQGKPVVFVHAWSMDQRLWEYQVFGLMERYRVITFDLRGHGSSDRPDAEYDLDTFATDLERLLAALDLTDVGLIGWSLGSYVVLNYMRRSGERVSKLGLVGGSPRMTREDGWPHGLDPQLLEDLSRQLFADRSLATKNFYRQSLHPSASEEMLDWIVRVSMRTPLVVAMKAFMSAMTSDLRGALADISVPAIVLHGEEDLVPIGAARFLSENLADAKLVTFPNSGHFPHLEESQTFNEVLSSFLAGS